jgi:hypothetical protein
MLTFSAAPVGPELAPPPQLTNPAQMLRTMQNLPVHEPSLGKLVLESRFISLFVWRVE